MIEITCGTPQLTALRVLAQDGLTFTDYCTAGLPVIVGHLSAAAQQRLAWREPAAEREYRHVVDLAPADRMLSEDDLAVRLASSPDAAPEVASQVRLVTPIVAAIAAFDRQVFGPSTRASLVWAQDRPGPARARDVRWHQDFRFRHQNGHPWRFYLTRSNCPTEFIRDHIGQPGTLAHQWFRNCYGLYEDPDRELLSDVDPQAWLDEMKRAQHWWRAEPHDVVLLSSNWHRSHRPATHQWSTFLHCGFH